MRLKFAAFALLPIGLALSACVSFGAAPPASLLNLTADRAPTPGDGARSSAVADTLTVLIPTVPQALRTPRVPVQTGATAIAYVKDAQWVEAPARLFQRLLADTIAASGQRVVIDESQYVTGSGELIAGQLLSFGVDAGRNEAVVLYQAQRIGRGGTAVVQRRFEAREPLTEVKADQVGAALNRAANRVAADVATWVAG